MMTIYTDLRLPPDQEMKAHFEDVHLQPIYEHKLHEPKVHIYNR